MGVVCCPVGHPQRGVYYIYLQLLFGPSFIVLTLTRKLLDIELINAAYVGLLVLGGTQAGLAAASGGDDMDRGRWVCTAVAVTAGAFYHTPSGCCKIG